MNTELINLIEYCQANGKVCPNPPQWEGMFKLIRLDKNYIRNVFPENPLILGVWHYSSDKEKQLRLAAHVYWSYKNNTFNQVQSYLMRLSEDKWHKVGNENGSVTLDDAKEECSKWLKSS